MPQLGKWGIDLNCIKPEVNPGDDFFHYVNGKWLESYELPPDMARYGSFNKLADEAEAKIKEILEAASVPHLDRTSEEQKIGDYYASFMNLDAVNTLGLEPLRKNLRRIDSIDSLDDLMHYVGQSAIHKSTVPFNLNISIDRKDPDRYLLSLGIGGLGMPDRDYYLDSYEQMQDYRDAYRQNIVDVLRYSNQPAYMDLADSVLALETEMATYHWTRADRRDREATYNVLAVSDFKQSYPGLNWETFFQGFGVDDPQELNVSFPSAMQTMIELVTETSFPIWKAYLTYHLIVASAFYLAEDIYESVFEFHSRHLNGVQDPLPRWKRGVQLVGERMGLGFLVGEVYVRKYFPPESKKLMDELVENVRSTFKERLTHLEWMSSKTRERALAKLASFRTKIGYPETIPDMSALKIKADDLASNVRAVREYWHEQNIQRLGKPTDREEWLMTPHTVNAYYQSSYNEIVFPAAILQAPFFDADADPAVNYGGIGVVIAHEMGHGFDDQGSKFDERGVMTDWWTKEDRTRFIERTKTLVEQYDSFEPVPGAFLDGEFTLGENIGDLGGVGIAYAAYKRSLNDKADVEIDNLTGDQRFFLSYGQIWRSAIREEELLKRIKSDSHSPAQYRVNGIVRNVDAWYGAFDIASDSALYLAPAERVSIW